MRENTDQKNPEYGHLWRSGPLLAKNKYEINFFPEGKDDCLQREYLFQLATTQNPNMWK